MLGEFCTGHAVGAGVLGEFCTGSGPPLGPVAGLLLLMGTGAGPSGPAGALHDGGGGGFARHEAFLRRVAGVSGHRVVQFPPRVVARARDLRGCGRQSADPLGDKSPKATVLAEWDCALVDVVSVVVYWSHANPLYRTRTRYLECGRGCPCSH